MRRMLLALGLLLSLRSARADSPPVVLRMAAVAPEGTAWAREIRAFGRDVEQTTGGKVVVKWYLGGIAGSELEALERIRRGQLDGEAGALVCEHLAPTLRVMRTIGVFQNRDEHRYVLSRLRPRLDAELASTGFVGLGHVSFGVDIIFSRKPVRSLADLKNVKLWVWSLDEVVRALATKMGLQIVPLPVEETRQAWDSGKIDGFIGLPTAALAFQWSTRARYFNDLRMAIMTGCMVVTARAFNRLAPTLQADVRASAAKFMLRFEDVGRAQDEALLNGLFEKQGLTRVPVNESFRASFFSAARAAREGAIDSLVPRELLDQVLGWLADFRAEHPSR